MTIGIVVGAILVLAGLAAAYVFLARRKGGADEPGARQAPTYAGVAATYDTDADADTSYADAMAAVNTNTLGGVDGLTIVNSAFRQEEEADYATSEGQQTATTTMAIAVQIMNRYQVKDRLQEAQVEGGYIVRANTEDDAASQKIVLSFYARGAIVHHTIIRMADGSFTLDGKPSTWPTLKQVFEGATERARQTYRFAAMQPVEPGAGIRTIDLLLAGTTNRVYLHDYAEPVQRNPMYETANPADWPSMEQDNTRSVV